MPENPELEGSLTHLEHLLSSKTVLGEPLKVDGYTLVPVLSVGLGFGSGSSNGKDQRFGTGGGLGAGGGVKPVALVIIDKDGLRVERLVGAAASTLESIAGLVGKMRERPAPKSEASN
jgi:uncharacterized spore protein YtfJ